MTRSYKQRLYRLHTRLEAAIIAINISFSTPAYVSGDAVSSAAVDDPQVICKQVADCCRLWQREKECLPSQHTYCPGETARRCYARVWTKFQDNTITSLGGKTPQLKLSVSGTRR